MERDRGTGRTTRQMIDAPLAAVYVWVNGFTDYPKRLAEKHGRTDLEIVPPSWLTSLYWHGRELSAVVVDHACHLTDVERDKLAEVQAYCVRKVQP